MKQMATIEMPEATLRFDQSEVEPEPVSLDGGSAAVFSLRCPGKESPSEDTAALIPYDAGSGILVVADGLGGLPAGDQASQVAVHQLRVSLAAASREGAPLRVAILDGFEAANQAVIEMGVGAATTLAVVAVQENSVRPYHVGDSMILVVGQRGKIKLESVSHSPVGYAIEAGFLDHEEAMHHEERHLISNMIGSSDMHITVGSSIELAPKDTVLVASDGLSDNLHLEEIVNGIRKGPLKRAAQWLAESCLQRMNHPVEGQPSKPDDLTAIVFRRNAKRS